MATMPALEVTIKVDHPKLLDLVRAASELRDYWREPEGLWQTPADLYGLLSRLSLAVDALRASDAIEAR